MMEKPSRFYIYCKKIYFTYKMQYFDNKEYHGWNEWSVMFGIGDKWFGREDWHYDGHTIKGFTVFGLMFAKMYTYIWEKK